MPKYEITITATYLVDLEDLERDRYRITMEYENPTLPTFIPEDAIEYVDGSITYKEMENN